jgi:transposase
LRDYYIFYSLQDGGVGTKMMESFSATHPMTQIQAHTRKEPDHQTDAFIGHQSLQWFGRHMVVNHSKDFVSNKTKNHINGTEVVWSYAKHILYNYRGSIEVSLFHVS